MKLKRDRQVQVIAELVEDNSIMVRAYEDKPVRLRVISTHEGIVEVAGQDEAASIGFPATLVYRFNEPLFDALWNAYENGDHSKLRMLWARAENEPIG